jgi:hypothetical protein
VYNFLAYFLYNLLIFWFLKEKGKKYHLFSYVLYYIVFYATIKVQSLTRQKGRLSAFPFSRRPGLVPNEGNTKRVHHEIIPKPFSQFQIWSLLVSCWTSGSFVEVRIADTRAFLYDVLGAWVNSIQVIPNLSKYI